jgi:hypothetical protein
MEKRFTDKQKSLVGFIAAGIAPAAAMVKAGYSPETNITQVTTPAMLDEVRRRTGDLLQHLAPRAVMVAAELMESTTASDKIRLDASRLVLDRAGYIAPKAAEAHTGAEKALHEMTREELAERAQRLQKEISERATVIVNDPLDEPVQPEGQSQQGVNTVLIEQSAEPEPDEAPTK